MNSPHLSPAAPVVKIDIGLVLTAFFDQVKPEYRKNMEHLWGIYSGEKHTLQETADVMGVTRERVRQKSEMVLQQFVRSTSRSLVVEWLQRTVSAADGVLSRKTLIYLLRQQLPDKSIHPEFVIRFLLFPELNIGKTVPYYPNIDAWVCADVDSNIIDILFLEFSEHLSSAVVSIQWKELFLKLTTRTELSGLDGQFAMKILFCLRDTGLVKRTEDGGWVNAIRRLNREDRVEAALRRIGRPAHFSEITQVHNELFPTIQKNERNINNILQNVRFVRMGRGKYGLPEWGLHDDGSIVQAAERVLRDANKPLPMPQIIERILQTWDVQPSSIVTLVCGSPNITRNEDGTYWFAHKEIPE